MPKLPDAKYQIGDKLYVVKGFHYGPFTVEKIIYSISKQDVQILYETVNPVNNKQLVAGEDELYTNFNDVKVALLAQNKAQGEIVEKEILKAKDPYEIIKENENKKPKN